MSAVPVAALQGWCLPTGSRTPQQTQQQPLPFAAQPPSFSHRRRRTATTAASGGTAASQAGGSAAAREAKITKDYLAWAQQSGARLHLTAHARCGCYWGMNFHRHDPCLQPAQQLRPHCAPALLLGTCPAGIVSPKVTQAFFGELRGAAAVDDIAADEVFVTVPRAAALVVAPNERCPCPEFVDPGGERLPSCSGCFLQPLAAACGCCTRIFRACPAPPPAACRHRAAATAGSWPVAGPPQATRQRPRHVSAVAVAQGSTKTRLGL